MQSLAEFASLMAIVVAVLSLYKAIDDLLKTLGRHVFRQIVGKLADADPLETEKDLVRQIKNINSVGKSEDIDIRKYFEDYIYDKNFSKNFEIFLKESLNNDENLKTNTIHEMDRQLKRFTEDKEDFKSYVIYTNEIKTLDRIALRYFMIKRKNFIEHKKNDFYNDVHNILEKFSNSSSIIR